MDPWLWAPAMVSLLAPVAAAWRTWAGWAVWCLALLATLAGYLMVAAGTALLGFFGQLLGFSPDWGAAVSSFGAPALLSTAVLAAAAHLTRRTARRSATRAAEDPPPDAQNEVTW